ncbi:MAG: L-seryl-tRNA(Sec) selenium transferase [Gammaproteobacteria bacterium]|nr:L-seryl-tRNA(Sec) selenium transferase [Gammaproteobacteria bacterium]
MQPRQLPAIGKLLEAPELQALAIRHGAFAVKESLRALQQAARQAGEAPAWAAVPGEYAKRIGAALAGRGYRAVHNFTGTLIHTNLGRSPLDKTAWEAVKPLVTGSMNLEYDLESGQRGDREGIVAERLTGLTGGEAATIVNNNAAALLLVLNTLALNRPVTVSRGELVEIGGSFRLPELMARSGCRLLEVGTTNRTHLRDYAATVGEAALLLKVHPSNYAIAGFTSEVGTARLAELARAEGLPFCVDLGSGALVDLTRFAQLYELMPRKVLDQGADLVTFSGDKLMGGVQAGLIVGRADLIAQLNANPLKRALRADKVTLALLNEVLKLHEDPERLPNALPVMQMLTRPIEELAERAERLRRVLAEKLPGYNLQCRPSEGQIGSGALPDARIESRALVIRHANAAEDRWLEQRLRRTRQVIGRFRHDALWLDVRSVADFEGALSRLAEFRSE